MQASRGADRPAGKVQGRQCQCGGVRRGGPAAGGRGGPAAAAAGGIPEPRDSAEIAGSNMLRLSGHFLVILSMSHPPSCSCPCWPRWGPWSGSCRGEPLDCPVALIPLLPLCLCWFRWGPWSSSCRSEPLSWLCSGRPRWRRSSGPWHWMRRCSRPTRPRCRWHPRSPRRCPMQTGR